MATSSPIWSPDPEWAASSAMSAFARHASELAGRSLTDFTLLHQWTVSEPEAFHALLWDATGIIGTRGDRIIEPGTDLLSTRFFPDASLSYVDNVLAGDADALAIVERREDGARRTVTRGELRAQVALVAGALARVGVVAGDRVAAWMPNRIETMVAHLGAASIGAVFSSVSPDFGVNGVVDRFGQIEPKVLFAVPEYEYTGKRFDCTERLAEIAARLPSVTTIVTDFDAFTADATPIAPQPFPFDHPLAILYSSGTTGAPKAIVHRAGGVLLAHRKEHTIHFDVRPGDVVFQFTTCGWMMWNWLLTQLAAQATIVLFDGAPMHPDTGALWRLADEERVTFFGVSAKYLDFVAKDGYSPRDAVDISSVRAIGSTGSPLAAATFEWVRYHVGEGVQVMSNSGGTDLCGCLVGGNPLSPVYAGEIQGPILGMGIDVWDEAGFPTRGDGELVCTTAFTSMPLGLVGDDDGARLRATYTERFDDVWAQGDFASWTEHDGLVITGRSDATLNPGGVRIGTAEIYRVVERLAEIEESLAVGRRIDDDVEIVLFVRLAADVTLDAELERAIRLALRTQASPRHVPAEILVVEDLPRTRSGKLAELAVADIVNGRTVRNVEALANPEALALFAPPA